jgi:TonB-linked SusC/RagA family outer membrane protein
LKEDLQNLDEVVVIGYGSAKKRDLTGAISTVKTEKLVAEAPHTVQDLLRGNSAGISVTLSSNAKGNADMQIRGKNSLKAGSSPLIVLDGVIYEGSLDDINPVDIETIDILKDASSAAVYGTKAANGVVVVNTRRGKTGKPQINFNASAGLAEVANQVPVLSAEQFLQYRKDYETGRRTDEYLAQYPQMFSDPRALSGVNQLDWYNYDQKTPVGTVSDEQLLRAWASRLELKSPEIDNFIAGRITDWPSQVLQTALQQDYTASISNSSDNMSYFWSVGYTDRDGIISGDTYSAIRTRLKLESSVTDWLTVGINTAFAQRDESGLPCSWENMVRISPFGANEIGNPDASEHLKKYPTTDVTPQNPFFDNMFRDRKKMYNTLNSNIYARINLPFGIEFQSNFIPRYQWYEYYNHDSSKNLDWKAKGGESTRETSKVYSWQVDNILRWKREFDRIHNVEVTLLANAEQYQSWQQSQSNKMYSPSDVLGYHRTQAGTVPLNSSNDEYQTGDALMARLFYSFRNRYLLTASVRRDGFSAFGQRNPRATFPAVALGWVFTSEKFAESLHDVINYGKLRVSWGKNGNRSIGRYDALSDMVSGAHPYIDANGNPYISSQLYVNRMSNYALKWENTAAFNVGLDFSFLNDRLGGSVEGYLSQTNDLLVDRALPEISGFNSVAANLGQIDNKGLEITLNAKIVDTRNLVWTSSVNFSMNRRKIVHLYGDMVDVKDEAGNVTGQKESDDVKNRWFIGQDPDRIWDYKRLGVWKTDEKEAAAKYGLQPGDFKYLDKNEDGVLTDDDKEFQGYRTPRFRWTWRNEFALYKHFALSFMAYSNWGHYDAFNRAGNAGNFVDRCTEYVQPYWTPENQIDDYARIGSKNLGTYYRERSFVRLENVTLSYHVPASLTRKFSVNNLRISLSVHNVGVFSPTWDFWDPERGWNYGDNAAWDQSSPTPRTYNLSFNFTL